MTKILISFEGSQDTSACQITGHSSHAFSRKFPEIAKNRPASLSQSAAKIRKINSKFRAIRFMRLPENARKPEIWHVPLSHNVAKMQKIDRS